MMLKLLIVEDEPLCLKSLEELDWASLGFDTVFTAQNGAEALTIALKEKPQIVLSDIQMPKVNGLDLAAKLCVNMPETKFIILTAYDNFSYAQDAVSNGVFSYILKPFLDEDVMEAVEHALEEVKKEQEKNSYNLHVAEQLELSKPFLMGYFFSTLKDYSPPAANDLFEVLKITHPNYTYTALVVSLEGLKGQDIFKENYRIFQHLTQIFTGINEEVLSFFETTHLVYFFAADEDSPELKAQSEALRCADAAQSYLEFNYGEKFVIGLGASLAHISNCETSYNSALDAIQYSFYLGFNSVICISDVEPTNVIADYQTFPREEFFGCIKAGDFENARFLLQRLFNNFRRSHVSVEIVRHVCHEILVRLALSLLQSGQNPDMVFNKTNVWEVIRQHDSIGDLESFLIDFVDVVISNITLRNSQKNQDMVQQVKQYIKTHLDTSLNEIADYFFHSPSYLSKIFSKEAGITIKNYMIQQRIARAKELLADPSKNISHIAAEVGYKNTQHFSTVFSKMTGSTPTAWRSALHSNM